MRAKGKLVFIPTDVRKAMVASKAERALVGGFSIYDPTKASGSRFRQVRAPTSGGIRHSSVRRNTTKQELIELIHPLFFPAGMNRFGLVNEFKFDISTDVHGTQLMHDGESVKDLIERLRLKRLRCYLLAKE